MDLINIAPRVEIIQPKVEIIQPKEADPQIDPLVKKICDENNLLTQILCALCFKLSEDLIKSIDGLSEWWDAHREWDKERELLENSDKSKM